MDQIKSRERIAEHGEVFTPPWVVDRMLGLVGSEAQRVDSRFLEPACGSGNFLVEILRRKLMAAKTTYEYSKPERNNYSLLALMCIYGIELQEDNVAECRRNLIEIFADSLKLNTSRYLHRAAKYVLTKNIIHGDTLTGLTHNKDRIIFTEWTYDGDSTFQRKRYYFDNLIHAPLAALVKDKTEPVRETVRDLAIADEKLLKEAA